MLMSFMSYFYVKSMSYIFKVYNYVNVLLKYVLVLELVGDFELEVFVEIFGVLMMI